MKRLIFFILLFYLYPAKAQVTKTVELDTVVIQAVRQGFDVADFIDMVKSDTSFHRGFRNLRSMSHVVTGKMTVFGKKHKPVASRYRKAVQHVSDDSPQRKRWIEITEEKTEGKFYDRNDEPKSYTAELFDAVFFYPDTQIVASSSAPIVSSSNDNGNSNTDKLKKLVFQPGVPIDGVPVIGKRLAIFDDEMTQYYNYSITARMFGDSVSCYVFSCTAKPEAGDYPVLRSLNTWFDRRTFQIVYRDYTYTYSGILFDFDVSMKVTMGYTNERLYPQHIEYSGFWDLPFRKQETVDFELDFMLEH